MLLRWPLPLAIVALMAVPASAADQSVKATPSSTFSPEEVNVDPGEKVTWANDGGTHNVKFDDGSFEQPSSPSATTWTVEKTFNETGTFRYYCEAHGGPGGSGMSGRVVVEDPNAPEVLPPGLTVAAPREQRLRRVIRRGVRARTHCENGCEARFRVSLSPHTAKRFGYRERRTTIATAIVPLDPATAVDVYVKLRDHAKRRLRGAKRSFSARLDVRATKDTSETARRTVTIKP